MIRAGLGLAWVALAAPAQAEVVTSSESGFVIEVQAKSTATAGALWARLIRPSLWWSSAHSWSGDAANMTLDARAGGCFCERWRRGSAEHGRVLQSVPGKLLRLSAPLGPMQSMAVSAVLTFELEPAEGGTLVRARYITGGNFGMDARKIAPAVDQVLREQVKGLTSTGAR